MCTIILIFKQIFCVNRLYDCYIFSLVSSVAIHNIYKHFCLLTQLVNMLYKLFFFSLQPQYKKDWDAVKHNWNKM